MLPPGAKLICPLVCSIHELDFFKLAFFLLTSNAQIANDDNFEVDNATMAVALYEDAQVCRTFSFRPAQTWSTFVAHANAFLAEPILLCSTRGLAFR